MTEIHWSTQSAFPILAILQCLPLLGALFSLMWRSTRMAILFGSLVALAELGLMVYLFLLYDDKNAAMQFGEQIRLLGQFSYHAAADGVTVLFLLLTALTSLLLILYIPARQLHSQPKVVALVFIVQAMLVSMLVTVNLLWFVFVAALQIIPVSYLLLHWSTSPMWNLALVRFLQFMGVSILLLLTGTLILGYNHAISTGHWRFDLFALHTTPVSGDTATAVFFLLFYGLAIRTPFFPLHGWLPMVAQHGSVAIAPVFLLGIKIGVYGLIRYVFTLLPETVATWQPVVIGFAVVGIFYAALLALTQNNLRRLLAFAVVSHTSVMLIGLFSLQAVALEGGIMLSVNFGLAITALLLMEGLIYRRTLTSKLDRLGGLFDRLPIVGITFLLAGLSIVGMPGTPGFDAVHLVLEVAIRQFGALVTIAAALGNVIAAGFLLLAFQRAFLSPRKDNQRSNVERATALEITVASLIIFTLLGSGFYSEPWLALIDNSLEQISSRFDLPQTH